jgi:hypothetical protein
VTSIQAGQSRNHGLTPGSVLFSKTSRLALAPIQPPIQWVLGIFYMGVNGQEHESDNLPLASPKIQSEWSNNSTPPCTSIVCTRTALSYYHTFPFLCSVFKVLLITFCTLPEPSDVDLLLMNDLYRTLSFIYHQICNLTAVLALFVVCN